MTVIPSQDPKVEPILTSQDPKVEPILASLRCVGSSSLPTWVIPLCHTRGLSPPLCHTRGLSLLGVPPWVIPPRCTSVVIPAVVHPWVFPLLYTRGLVLSVTPWVSSPRYTRGYSFRVVILRWVFLRVYSSRVWRTLSRKEEKPDTESTSAQGRE